VTSNSSALQHGNEALIEAMERIRNGQAIRMLAGGSEGRHPISGRLRRHARDLRKFNDRPEQASRPMSETACGFVPGAGGAMFMLEGARIGPWRVGFGSTLRSWGAW